MQLLGKLLDRDRAPEGAPAMRAVWKDEVLAESRNTITVDGRRYFPPDDVAWEFLRTNDRETVCAWKGVARYYDVEVGGELKRAAAWVYPSPQPAAASLKDHVAFARGVKVRSAAEA